MDNKLSLNDHSEHSIGNNGTDYKSTVFNTRLVQIVTNHDEVIKV